MIRQERGNALLVGVGGTGKQSLTRLASHMCGYRCFQIELSRGYSYDSFHDDLRKLYKMAGVEGKDMVFLFTDTQVCVRGVVCVCVCVCVCKAREILDEKNTVSNMHVQLELVCVSFRSW